MVTELATAADEGWPALTADGLTVFWSSTRTDGGAKGGWDIWTARRTSLTAPFSSPRTCKR
jgi:hypothetical protein